MANKEKFAGLSALRTFLDNCREIFATKSDLSNKANTSHTHTIANVTNLQTTLDTINNDISGKANLTHSHVVADITNLQSTLSTNLETAKSYTDTKTSNLASTTVVDNKVSAHNVATDSHSDIRLLITNLTTKLNTLANSTDEDLDQMAEIVAYIKSNKALIDSITTNKVNVSDIVNNLTTNVSNKPLSAAQGVAIKTLIDELESVVDTKAPTSALENYYTKSEIDNYEFITVNDIDSICGTAIQVATASEVTF